MHNVNTSIFWGNHMHVLRRPANVGTTSMVTAPPIVSIFPTDGGLRTAGDLPNVLASPLIPIPLTSSGSNAWDVAPLRVVLQTHVGTPASTLSSRETISIILDTSMFDGFGQVTGVVQHAPVNANVFVYVGLSIDGGVGRQPEQFYNALHNSSVPRDTHVDFVGLGIPLHTKQQTRLFKLAAHALSTMAAPKLRRNRPQTRHAQDDGGSILILHHSCVVDSHWDVSALARRGHGFLLLPAGISNKELYTEIAEHDLGLASVSIGPRRPPPEVENPFHCTGSIMHALHGPRRHGA